jgi:transposase
VTKTYRHLNFFQHECELEVRVPRVKLPDGSVRQVTPPWAGKLSGFTLLFEAFVLLLCREMTFSGVARITGLSVHRVMAVCDRYVNMAVSAANFSEVRRLAIDETSRAKGHDYVSLFADADERKVLYVAEGREAQTVAGFAANLRAHQGKPTQIESISIDMSPALIAGVEEHFPDAQITFDVEPIKEVASMILNHFEGVLAWANSRLTTAFSKQTMVCSKRPNESLAVRTVIFLIAGKLDFSKLSPYIAQPT